MVRTLLSALSLTFAFASASAQGDYTQFIDNRGDDAVFAPKIGLGTGFFTYLGDVRDNNLFHPFTSSWGYEFFASANFSKHFDLDLNIVYGDITVNERSRDPLRNRNFRSELFVGGVGVSYNFNHLYKKKPGVVQPFVSVGVSFVHFDSKTDLHDANGNRYHYWSDGAIMDRPEDSETAHLAVELQRDYNFETDLREMNNDGLGKYDLFTVAIPFRAGLDFKMGRRLSARLSTAFHYTLTDLIDDFTHRGEGDRQGNSANDMFFYTSMQVNYAIGVKVKKPEKRDWPDFEEFDFMALYLADEDGDGVPNFQDSCHQTLDGVEVDERGCPVDSDRDLIPDYRDKEEFTGIDKIANLDGIGLTDAMMWERYIDSVATARAMIPVIFPSGVMERPETADGDSKTVIVPTGPAAKTAPEQGPQTAATADQSGKGGQTGSTATAKAASPKPADGPAKGDARKESKAVVTEPAGGFTDVSAADRDRLSKLMSSLAQEAGRPSESGAFMDRVMEEVFKGSPDRAANVDEVYDVAYRIYGEMVDKGEVGRATTVNITKEKPKQTLIPEKFLLVDINGDGLISADEVLKAIEELMDGSSLYSAKDIFELVELYRDKMEGARVVDFGGTLAVYVDGKLNILPNRKDDGLTPQQRFLARKFQDVDYNGDGRLTPDEVNRIIKEFQAGRSRYTADDINELIDLFFED
jgi:Ca2+-binding EF-hand superfamily protein